MGSYLTTNPNTCQVYLSDKPLQGSSMYFAGLPTVVGTRIYDWYAFSQMYPGWTSVPIKCITGKPAPTAPAPQPPVQDPDPPPAVPKSPITGDPPPEECGTGPGIIKDDRKTSSSWWSSGSGKGAGGTDGDGPYDQLAQPVVVGMTPLGNYSAKKPVYTKQPYFEIRTGDDHAIMDAYHEGTGQGMLVFHSPELMDYHLYGPGQITGLANKWPTNISASSLILFNSTRPDSSTGDNPTMYLGFGRVLEGAPLPALGHYFSLNLSTSEFILASTDSLGMDDADGTFTLKQMLFNVGQSTTANLSNYSGVQAGSMIWDTDDSVFKYYTGAAWANLAMLNADGDLTVPGKLTVTGLIDPTGLVLTEQASTPWTPAAGYGALYVKNTAPSTLIFVNDAGGEVTLGAGGSGDVTGPGSSTTGNFPSFSDGTGKVLQDSGFSDASFAAAAHSHADYLEIANDLSDVASDDTALVNLITGATDRTPLLGTELPGYNFSGATTSGGALTVQQLLNLTNSLAEATSVTVATDQVLIDQGGTAKQMDLDDFFGLAIGGMPADTPVQNDIFGFVDVSETPDKLNSVTFANLLGSSWAKTVDYTGSGSSGKTVTLTGINRAHHLFIVRNDASASEATWWFAGGGTGTIRRMAFSNTTGTECSLDAPAAGSAQTLTINTNGVWINGSAVSYRIFVVGTPT